MKELLFFKTINPLFPVLQTGKKKDFAICSLPDHAGFFKVSDKKTKRFGCLTFTQYWTKSVAMCPSCAELCQYCTGIKQTKCSWNLCQLKLWRSLWVVSFMHWHHPNTFLYREPKGCHQADNHMLVQEDKPAVPPDNMSFNLFTQ